MNNARKWIAPLSLLLAGMAFMVWYFKAPAKRPAPAVAVVETKKPNGFQDQGLMAITPLADGGAYAVGVMGEGVWYLRGPVAVRVQEAKDIKGNAVILRTPTEKWLWATLQQERQERNEMDNNVIDQ